MQFSAYRVHHREKVASLLEPYAMLDLEATHGSELAQGWVRQCAADVLQPFRVFTTLFSDEFWSTFGEVERNGHSKSLVGGGGEMKEGVE